MTLETAQQTAASTPEPFHCKTQGPARLQACPTVDEGREADAMSKSGDVKTARIVLTTLGDVAVAVMTARRMARDLGFGETDEFGIGTAVSELATNAIRYARLG